MTKNYPERTTLPQFESAIALGSNLGDREKTLNQAIIALKDTEGIEIVNHSQWYQSKPVGPPQPDYLNGCAIIKTSLNPHQLLQTLLNIEQQFGRERKERWGPRTLDLDIIFYGDLIFHTPELEIPHPRMRERIFVLEPLVEIVPHWCDPVTGLTVTQLWEKIR